jgi:hypothetical protein
MVYPRLTRGGTIAVHDYGWSRTPGVKTACNRFLRDKPETVTLGYGYAWIRKSFFQSEMS